MVDEVVNRRDSLQKIWTALENVKDPEIPVLSVVDMGIITSVEMADTGAEEVRIVITPTFVGCPAIGVIKTTIYEEVKKLGFNKVEVAVDYETTWSSNR